jgi:signal transduction histidine kinase/CheY-like chemotaxis protein
MRGKADAYPFRTLAAPLRFAIALAAVATVFAIDHVSGEVIDDGSMFLLLGTAVMASAWFAGTGPALAATVLGALIGAFEAGGQTGTDGAVPTHLALFLVQGLVLTAVVSELRAARRSSEQQTLAAQAARREGEAANRMKDEFLATVSHELRTPLNAMLGWVHLLRTGKLDQSTSERGLESIERNVRLQAQLTGDLLDVSKALTGQLQLNCRPTTLVEAAQQAMSALGSAARAKGVALDMAVPDSPIVILGDQTRLRQIAWHLLANAIKFTPRAGVVKVVVEQSQGEARLIVIDSGQGIDPQFLPRIFDRFTQADPSPTRSAGGLGVGLALVRELVELHGGEIEARNEAAGAGAIFTARFPLQPADLLERAPQRVPATVQIVASPPLDGVRVLVLDANLESSELLRAVLQQRGATVRTVASVADALESLEAWRPDVLVSDRTSSDQASYALVGKVHSLDAQRGGRIPAFVLTTRAQSDKRLGRMLADVQSELLKPVEPAVLASEIARLTGRERRRAQR